jgi:hypothetical protein
VKKPLPNASGSSFIRATNATYWSNVSDSELPVYFSDSLLDLVKAFDQGLRQDTSHRAISLIGPYGSGKSTGLVALKLLCDQGRAAQTGRLWSELRKVDAKLSDSFTQSLKYSGELRFIFINASERPLTEVLLSELAGIERSRRRTRSSLKTKNSKDSMVVKHLKEALRFQNIVVVIDEFGRILERAIVSGSTAELQLLQDLAELTPHIRGKKLLLITAQHHSTSDYSHSGSESLARELAKVQGRFQEILFLNSVDSSLKLLAAEIASLRKRLGFGYRNKSTESSRGDRDGTWALLRECFPLNPIAALTLVELSRRYAQSTRTLMTFLKSDDQYSLLDLLNSSLTKNSEIYVDDIFDYFVTSQVTAIHASDSDSKWREIASIIRDNEGLNAGLLSLLKTVAALNLAASSTIEARFETLALAARVSSRKELRKKLVQLQTMGLVTLRDRECDYRVWRGSAFPINAELKKARSKVENVSTRQLVSEYVEPNFHFARRAGVETGIDRAFAETAATPEWRRRIEQFRLISTLDGAVLLAFDSNLDSSEDLYLDHSIPTVVIFVPNSNRFRTLVTELAALHIVKLHIPTNDSVATREIDERIVYFASKTSLELKRLRDCHQLRSSLFHNGRKFSIKQTESISNLLSEVTRIVFHASPIVRNEMLAGRTLSSQGAKAVRLLTESMFKNSAIPRFGIEGNSAEGAVYDAVFALTGLGLRTVNVGKSAEVSRSWSKMLGLVRTRLTTNSTARVSVSVLVDLMTSAPFGIRKPLAVLIITALMNQEKHQFSLFEHGSLVVNFDEAVAERLQRNPEHFSYRTAGPSSKQHREMVLAYQELLEIKSRPSTSVEIATVLINKLGALPNFSLNTVEFLQPTTVRLVKALREATDPDSLLFVDIPEILLETSQLKKTDRFINRSFKAALRSALDDLVNSYDKLLKSIDHLVLDELRVSETSEHPSVLARGAALAVRKNLMHPRQRALVEALLRDDLSDSDWTQNLAMVVSQSGSPRNWGDENVMSFKVALKDQMGGFRRLLSLCVQAGDVDDSAGTYALLNLVSTDGTHADQIIHISNGDRLVAKELQEIFATKVRELSGSDQIARALMLSLLFDIPLTNPTDALTFRHDQAVSEPVRSTSRESPRP